jgi:pimeloyl-ACP methyl ester carboxylesterase
MPSRKVWPGQSTSTVRNGIVAAGMGGVQEHTADFDGQPVWWRAAPPVDGGAPILYVHGVPTNADVWAPFLARTGGIAVDLPGFGRSGKRGDLDYSVPGYAAFLQRFLDLLGIDSVRLVAEDWGVAALGWAQEQPERVERLVLIDAVPLLPGLRWHRLARVWRTPGLGEVAMGLSVRPVLRRALAPQLVDLVADHLDQGTQRAILDLYRWADPVALAAAGARLAALTAPALVVWGERDPYLPVAFASAWADALGGPVDVDVRPGAGHWPWLDDPAVIDHVVEFLQER